MTSNAHAEERQYKKMIYHQHDIIVIIAFLLSHNTQQKDRNKSSKCLVCSQDTAQKVLNSLFLMMQAWMFSYFVPPLVRNYVVGTL